MSSKAIAVESVSKRYDIYDKPHHRLLQMLPGLGRSGRQEFWAVKNVSFEIGRGETVGIIGRNGSGKSTLLQMICGTVPATTGAIQTNGRIAALLELGAGFNAEFSGRENVMMNGAILGVPREEMLLRMHQIIDFAELEQFIDQPVKTYSSGMYARLAFSVAINVDPEILIVDEALAVGDARFVSKCMKRIRQIQELGATVLFVSHDVGAVRTLCDRAIWLNKGEVEADGDVFPVTGRFMEYMFRDELSQESSVSAAKKLVSALGVAQEPSIEVESQNSGTEAPAPVTHWGSHHGLIKDAWLNARQKRDVDVVQWGERIEVCVALNLPKELASENLCVAFSIKDLKGTDIVVSTTLENETGAVLPTGRPITVRFSFINGLTSGKYVLVATVEDRQRTDVHYYEYIEGVRYFVCSSDKALFGLFHPEVCQEISLL